MSGPNPVPDRRKYTNERRIEDLEAEIESLKLAFPEDEMGSPDVPGHRRYHEAKIAAAKAEAEFWRELKLEIAKKGLWFLITVLAGLVVVGLMAKLGLNPAGNR